ncbi:class IV adenylate cyclase [Halomicrobium sp. IBSBa]|uniref:class IV adenylate cyclase n=1 Tax=Halomicrobium sp. IBSBa TaxID=2778916 RepID=UPI001ABF62AC|nr:class IV adenylate cyclase [Halomicrobium sp. IBSBa]MBO4248309.1 class IV adenylate cyclase [Halomicrobium sp. IBSBa]
MYEVELKVETDHEPVRERLDELGATFLGTVEQADTYYDAPHREFAETDEALRVRRETVDGESSAVMTYKGPKVDAESKTREEIETGVGDGDDAAAIFESVGFEAAATVRKERDRYRLDGYTVTLDSVAGAGSFVEVETEAEKIDAAREGAADLMRDLGLNPDDQIRTSYLGLLLDDADADARE